MVLNVYLRERALADVMQLRLLGARAAATISLLATGGVGGTDTEGFTRPPAVGVRVKSPRGRN